MLLLCLSQVEGGKVYEVKKHVQFHMSQERVCDDENEESEAC